MKPVACPRHPQKVARRRCFYCHRPICPQCTLRASHHFFCSVRCHWRYRVHRVSRRLLLRLKPQGRKRKLPAFDRQLVLQTAEHALVLLMIFFLFYNLLILRRQVVQLDRRVERLGKSVSHSSPEGHDGERAPALLDGMVGLSILQPAQNAVLSSPKVSIVGEAPEDYVVVLLRGDRPIAAAVPRDHVFRFSDIEAEPGENRFLLHAIDLKGGMNLVEKLTFRYRNPKVLRIAADLRRGRRTQKKLALTFDGGALDNAAGPILDILREKGIRTTLFLTGRFMQRYPDIVRRIVADGHEVGNHTWSHPHLTTYAQNRRHDLLPGVTREFFQKQLQRTAELFHQLTGKQMAPFWRAPYGEENATLRLWAAELGFRHVGWTAGPSLDESMDTLDWLADSTSSAYRSSEEILQHLLRLADLQNGNGAAGGIVLMHLGSERRSDPVYRILPDLITQMRARGYRFVPVSQLIEAM